ncbi:MAG: hypothetical protein QG567_770, partial [Campylobacterota bacterium]|nr:hypothetical protein [Campylobacterota bacterium]
SQVDERGAFDPKERRVFSLGAKAVLFDGFKRENILDEKEMEFLASQKKSDFFKKSLALDVSELFFAILNTKEELKAKEQKGIQLEAQVNRLQKFYEAGSVTLDSVEKIKASKAMNDYEIEMILMNLKSLEYKLKNIAGAEFQELQKSSVLEPQIKEFETRDDLAAMEYDVKALEYKAKQANSDYYPSVFIEDTYSSFDYVDANPMIDMVDNQNKITIGASMTLFDFFSKSKEKEIVELNSKKAKNSYEFYKKEAKDELKLAIESLNTAKKKISAANSRLIAANKTYELISQKFGANLVDNVTYLDALSEKYSAESLYQQSLNNYEYEKLSYYFYASEDIKEFIK